MMLKMPDVLLLLCLFGATDALYKQWIPDTNYENSANWDTGFVPCGKNGVHFLAQTKVSIYMETIHSVYALRLPLDGEFILNSGAGFYMGGNQGDPGCGPGGLIKFNVSENVKWFNPALWQLAASLDDLDKRRFLFAVHEETVPCQYDDVVFKAKSSFRVDTTSNGASIPVKTVSVLGKTFSSDSEFSQYLSSNSGRLQFQGSSAVKVGNPGCSDPSGCDCGNSAKHDLICSGVTSPTLTCKKPLQPAGHCHAVCGAIVTVYYADGFNLEAYRQRLQHLFLIKPSYKSIQLGMSKIFKPQRLMGVIPFGSSAEIQIVILDGETGSTAEALARDILKDVHSEGSHLGIAGAEFQASSGSSSNDKPGPGAGVAVGAVFGVLIVLALIGIMVMLVRKGVVQVPKVTMPSMPSMPSIPSMSRFKNNSDVAELGGPIDRGFDNPMFDKPTLMPAESTLYTTEANQAISMTQSGVHFVNPVYDDNETDFNA